MIPPTSTVTPLTIGTERIEVERLSGMTTRMTLPSGTTRVALAAGARAAWVALSYPVEPLQADWSVAGSWQAGQSVDLEVALGQEHGPGHWVIALLPGAEHRIHAGDGLRLRWGEDVLEIYLPPNHATERIRVSYTPELTGNFSLPGARWIDERGVVRRQAETRLVTVVARPSPQ
jgi:hypothetical protein